MLAVFAASLLARANNTTYKVYNTCFLTSISQLNLYRNTTAIAMQHLHCIRETLKNSQLFCLKRMCLCRWHHCLRNILHATCNFCFSKRMCMVLSFLYNSTKIINTNISIKRIKRPDKNNNKYRVTRRGSGVSMKLYLASSMFNNNTMCGKFECNCVQYLNSVVRINEKTLIM